MNNTIVEFARIVSKLVGVPFEVEHKAMPVDDPARRCPDISRAKALLAREPQISLEEGVHRTIASFLRSS